MSFLAATASGVVLGESDGAARVWRGVPYADPPVGPWRWRAPRPVTPWAGVRDATRFGPACPQFRPRAAGAVGPELRRDEDCLTLNVWAPSDADAADGPFPVVVWVHGGAFVSGAGSLPDFRGAGLAGLGLVVVTVNYRVGAFGFLDLSSFSTPEVPFDTNLGLRDVTAALRWVRENVGAFGGDPDRVTVMGESAGASLVTALLASPPARGLFERAVAFSPAPAAVYSPGRMARYAGRFLDLVGADRERPETWRDVPAQALVEATTRLLLEVDESDTGTIAFAPVVDGDVVPEPPLDAAAAGRTVPVPLLVGTTRNEALLFLRARPRILPVTTDRVDRVFDALADQQGGVVPTDPAEVLAGYPGFPAREAVLEFAADSTFRIPAIRFAEGHGQVAPVWMYRYDFATPAERMVRLDATHGTEIPLVFDTLDAPVGRLIVMLGGRAAAERLGARIRGHVADFARSGRPAFGWPRYVPPTRTTLILDRELRIAQDPQRQAREVWEQVEFLR